MKKLMVIIALLAIGFSPCIGNAETVLTFANPDPPNSALVQRFWVPWVERINKASDGELRIEIKAGSVFSTLLNSYDRVTSGAADMAWAMQDLIRGKFPLTIVGSLPYEVNNAEDGSVAMWRLFKSGITAGEYSEIEPLGLFMFPQAGIHTKPPVNVAKGLDGLRIRSVGNISGETVVRLGASSVSIPLHELYQSLSRGVVDGAITQWTGVGNFKLFEVTTHHVDSALGSTNVMVCMNKKSLAKLSAKAKKALLDNCGEKLSREFGAFLDNLNNEYREMVKNMKNQEIITLSASEAKIWKDKVIPINQEWADNTPGGAKVLEAYRQEVKRIQQGK